MAWHFRIPWNVSTAQDGSWSYEVSSRRIASSPNLLPDMSVIYSIYIYIYIFHIWLNHLYLPSREFGCLYMCIYRFRTLPNKAYFHIQLPGTCWRQLEPDPWISSKPSLSSGVWWDLGRGYNGRYRISAIDHRNIAGFTLRCHQAWLRNSPSMGIWMGNGNTSNLRVFFPASNVWWHPPSSCICLEESPKKEDLVSGRHHQHRVKHGDKTSLRQVGSSVPYHARHSGKRLHNYGKIHHF